LCTFAATTTTHYKKLSGTWKDLSATGGADTAATAFPGDDVAYKILFKNVIVNSFDSIFGDEDSMDVFV